MSSFINSQTKKNEISNFGFGFTTLPNIRFFKYLTQHHRNVECIFIYFPTSLFTLIQHIDKKLIHRKIITVGLGKRDSCCVG
jgi:hypothetical protein